jgi:hypothetical protein
MPLLAVLLGIAGLIPFIVCGLGAVSVDPITANRMLTALVGYGAVILSFIGGVHWGFALSAPAAPVPLGTESPSMRGFFTAERSRLVFGVVPSLIGWLALLLQMLLLDWVALMVLIVGFIGTVVVEHQAARRTLLQPARYIWLRWGLTVVVVAMLVTVLTLRLLGRHIY